MKLTPRKGAGALLRAFATITRPEARLVVAGSDMGSGVGFDALAGHPRVRCVGLLTGAERLDALAAANVVVYPSRDEVFGLVPLEALLSGSPVIVCNDSGAGEIIGTVGGGHIVPPDDEASLAGAIESMLAANGLWRRRARTAADRVRQRFGADAVVERLDALYHGVLGRRASPGIGAPREAAPAAGVSFVVPVYSGRRWLGKRSTRSMPNATGARSRSSRWTTAAATDRGGSAEGRPRRTGGEARRRTGPRHRRGDQRRRARVAPRSSAGGPGRRPDSWMAHPGLLAALGGSLGGCRSGPLPHRP